MTYEETYQWMLEKLPMFQQAGARAFKKDLTNIRKLCEALGNPQNDIRFIHVAGTNGKGSVSNFLASIYQEAGYRTGLYTSPHLKDFRERIRINGQMVSKQYVIAFIRENKELIQEIQPSFFEITVAMALDSFRKNKVDIAIIEVGLGGRLDSTNIIVPLLSVITRIGFDHMDFLGNTLPEIAREKAGIIKEGIPVLIGRSQKGLVGVFRNTARSKHAPIQFADRSYCVVNKVLTDKYLTFTLTETESKPVIIKSPYRSVYQVDNIRTVFAAVRLMNDLHPELKVSDSDMKRGFLNTFRNTGFAARWQSIAHSPLTIVDAGHNADGLSRIREQLRHEKYKDLHIIFGSVKDKDHQTILRILPRKARYYLCAPPVSRAEDPEMLLAKMTTAGLSATTHGSPKEALRAAREQASPKDLILITGSVFLAGLFV